MPSERFTLDRSARSSASGTLDTYKSGRSSFSDDSILTENVFKVIFVGDSGVGKTCLFSRVCHGKKPSQNETTIGVDYANKCYSMDGTTIKLHIWDTAGQERFRCGVVRHYYRDVDAVIFVYDVNNTQTFDNLKTWIAECDANIDTHNIQKIIIGNKHDLESRVPIGAAMRFGDANKMPVFQVSSTDDKGQESIDTIFKSLAFDLNRTKAVTIEEHQPIRVTRKLATRSRCC